MQYTVTPFQEVNFGATGVEEVLQNVAFILSTMIGTCPLDREFGWEPDLDDPIDVAQATNTARIIQAIQEHEKRAIVDEVQVTGNPLDGQLKVIIRVTTDGEI